jgi:hypothetical protein
VNKAIAVLDLIVLAVPMKPMDVEPSQSEQNLLSTLIRTALRGDEAADPVRVVPDFMSGVESITQIDDTRNHWGDQHRWREAPWFCITSALRNGSKVPDDRAGDAKSGELSVILRIAPTAE